MSITTPAFCLAFTAAALVAAAPTADARPRRVVVLDFDGPRQLADSGRSTVLSALGGQYDVVATRRWEQARAAASQQSHGPAQWSRAAKQVGVDAVIEGWVQDEGRRKILNVLVRQANNGREFDTISVRIDGKAGVSADAAHQLQSNLDEVLEWIDAGQSEAPPGLPVIEVRRTAAAKPAADDGAPARGRSRGAGDDGGAPARGRGRGAGDEVPPDSDSRKRARRSAGEPDTGPEPAGAAPLDDSEDSPAPRPSARSADRTAPVAEPAAVPAEPAHDARPVEVSTAAREAHEIEVLFPQGSDERREVLGVKAEHVPQQTVRFMIDSGPYLGSRSLLWDTVDTDTNLSQFGGVTTKGLELSAAVYPFPLQQTDGVLSGFGVTGSLHHSLGSTVEFDDGNQIEEYVINQNGWELGAHYRAPLSGLVAIDGGVFYGNQTFEIVDAPADLDVPDTKYSYLGASAHLDLAITDRAQIGFGARYFTVLDAGDLASVDYFGPVSASGLGLEGSFTIPLPARLYVRGEVAYQRISLETSGGGQLTDDQGVTAGTDSQVRGKVSVGVAF